MALIANELMRTNMLPGVSGVEQFLPLLAKVVWALYYKERDAGLFKIKVWFITVDISSKVADLLTRWFGPDPLAR